MIIDLASSFQFQFVLICSLNLGYCKTFSAFVFKFVNQLVLFSPRLSTLSGPPNGFSLKFSPMIGI